MNCHHTAVIYLRRGRPHVQFIISSLLLTAFVVAVSISSTSASSPSAVAPTPSPTTVTTSPFSVDGRKKKKRRRKRKGSSSELLIESLDTTTIVDDESDSIENTLLQAGAGIEDGELLQRGNVYDGTKAQPLSESIDRIIHNSDTVKSNNHRVGKKKRKRRRKFKANNSVNEDEENIVDEESIDVHIIDEGDSGDKGVVLLPIADGDPVSKGGDDSFSSVEMGTTNTIHRKKRRKRRKNPTSDVKMFEESAAVDDDTIQTDEKLLLPIDGGDISEDEDGVVDLDNNVKQTSNNVHSDDESITTADKTPPVQSSSEPLSEKVLGDEAIQHDDESSAPVPSIVVTRNETLESTTIYDDSNPDAPTTFQYTKQGEEETVEGVIHITDDAGDDDSMVQPTKSTTHDGKEHTPTVTAFVHSSQKSENIQITGGSDGGQSVTVNVSRQRKVQHVHITTNHAKATTKKKKSSLAKPKAASKSAVTSRGASTGKGGECLRRIKREWKDAVKMGIAYDWINMRTINTKQQTSNSSSSSNNNNNNDYVRIGPLGKNLLRWHFSVAGPANSVYEAGVYHGRVLLPKDYPGSPPRVQMLTPSGRFLCGADICLSASSYHPETWSPRWTVLSLVDALRLHMLTTANEIGGVMSTNERREEYADASRAWRSPGVVDHGQMVAGGMFPLRSEEEDESILDEDVTMEENKPMVEPMVESINDDKGAADIGHGQDVLIGQSTGLIETDQEQADASHTSTTKQSPTQKKSKKSRKSSQQKKPQLSNDQSQSQPGIKSKSTKVVKPKSKKDEPSKTVGKTRKVEEATATSAATVENAETSNEIEQRGIVSILLIRICIEALKLPLRVLSVILRIMSTLESRLRAFLDSL